MNSSLRCKQQESEEIWGPDWLHAWTYLNNYSTVSTISRYRVVIKVVFCNLFHNITENITKKVQKQERKIIKNEKRCRNGVPKVHEQGRIKVLVDIQSLIPTSLLFCKKM